MTPILTTAEFRSSGTGVGTLQLAKGGNYATNDAALAGKIAAATGWMSVFCNQVLTAERRTECADLNPYAKRLVLIPPAWNVPISIVAAWIGPDISRLTSVDISTLRPDNGVFKMPWPTVTTWAGSADPVLKFEYVAGFPNPTLADVVAEAATELTVGDVTGIAVGDVLTIPDGEKTEQVTVSAVTTGTVTTGPTAFAHDPGTAIHAVPAHVKEAGALVTKAMILGKVTGAASAAIGAASQPSGKGNPMRSEDLDRAGELLADLVLE